VVCLALASALLVVVVVAELAAQEGGVSLTVTSPSEGDYLGGPVVLSARVIPFSTAVRHVTFTVDGQLVCTVVRPPYDCPWNAGPSIKAAPDQVQAASPTGSASPVSC
jgi:hypothetical protein